MARKYVEVSRYEEKIAKLEALLAGKQVAPTQETIAGHTVVFSDSVATGVVLVNPRTWTDVRAYLMSLPGQQLVAVNESDDPAPDALQPTDDEVKSALDKVKDESDQS